MLKRVLSVIFSCMLSLFLAILGLGVGLCHFGQASVCNPDTLQKNAVDSGYVQQLYGEIVYDWENYLAITGVETPEDIMTVLTQEQVTQDALLYLSAAYSGSATVNTDALRDDLESKIREYAYSHNIYETPEEELEQNIQDLVDACIDDYRNAISIPMLTKILGTINRYGSVLPICMLGLAIGCIVILLFLFFLQQKRQDALYYAAISAATGSIVLLGIPKLATYYNIVNRLPFTDSALKTLVRGYLQTNLNEIGRYGMAFLIIAAAALVLYIAVCIIVAVINRRKNTVPQELNENTEERI